MHIAPVGEDELKKRMTEWVRFINDDDTPFMIKALVGHYFFENTHPFYDGNGRTGRYILSMYLSRKLDKYTGISFSQAVHATKSKYYKAFKKTGDHENRAEGTFFVKDLLDLISQSQNTIIETLENRIDNFKKVIQEINKQYSRDMPENYVLFLLAQSRLFNDSIETGLRQGYKKIGRTFRIFC
ncbi:Fic family protein [Pediococcus acidilactici]|uniref:Fic family protein n=1 Tax=Pediococcus acidilactici TaxID=1254 RepID=UPI003B42CC15